MTLNSLYLKLKDAYTEQNLNNITSKIVEWYKDKQYAKLKRFIEFIGKHEDLEDESISKSFSKLIFLYHPDKGHQYRTEIDRIFASGNMEELKKYTHILSIQNIENMPLPNEEGFDIDYSPEYVMDEDIQDLHYFEGAYPQSDDLRNDFADYAYDNTFYSAIKRKFYNNMAVDLPSYYLEDLEEVEMSDYDICDLSGIEYCKHTVFLNLSNNCITDISELDHLTMIEELYLADNEIGYIDAASNLLKLRVIDISNNNIDDLSPLYDLPDLEYVNIVGNRIAYDQIDFLKTKGVLVVH